MRGRKSAYLRIISAIIIIFFVWTFCGIYDIAYAIDTPSATKPSPKAQRPEARFQKAIEDIENTINDPSTSTDTKKAKLKIKKSEIEAIDIEIKNQFAETEKKLKDANLPDKILQRHYKFVKHYEDNLSELKANLDDIDKAKTDDEHKTAIEKTKAHLARVKPPKKHTPLDPNKLPHRSAEPVYKEPRTKPEEFMKDLQARDGNGNVIVASMGSLSGLLSMTATTGAIPAPTSADLAETVEVKFTNAIEAKAAELNHQPLKIYEWVRNNVEYVPTFGSIQGADMCLQTMQCNDMDTASLLIALLRVSGVHSRYVYGTIEVPIEKFMNWTGGFTNASASLDFAASGGIPITGLVSGGTIKTARLEHVWVDAWIDYIPNRGAKHKKGDTWIQLDGSYKNYTYTSGIDLSNAVTFDGTDFNSKVINSNNYNESESYISGFDQAYFDQAIESHITRTTAFVNQTNPSASYSYLYGEKKIVKHEFPYLMGTLMNKSTLGYRTSELPDGLRHKITISIEDALNDYQMNITVNSAEVAGKRLGLSYVPATSEDAVIKNSYYNAQSLPVYLINVKPQLRLDGNTIAEGQPVQMGLALKLNVSLKSPWSTELIRHSATSGDYSLIGLNFGTGKLSLDEKTAKAENYTIEDAIIENLYEMSLAYWMENDKLSSVMAKKLGVAMARYPSEGLSFAPIDVEYVWGAPMSGSFKSSGLDIKSDRSTMASLQGNAGDKIRFNMIAGILCSALEGALFDQAFPSDSERGISAIKITTVALRQGIPVYGIDKNNIDSILGKLNVDPATVLEVKNAVNAGKIVIMPQRSLTYAGWTGESYIVLDPKTGDGAYMIAGGTAGGRILMSMEGTAPLNKAYVKGMQDSLDAWLVGAGTSLAEVLTASGRGGYCKAAQTGFLWDKGDLFANIGNALRYAFASVSSFIVKDAEAVACAIAIPWIVSDALPLFAVMAMIVSRTLSDVIKNMPPREENWKRFIHITDCNGLFGIMASHFIWTTDDGDYGYGVYLSEDLYGRHFPYDAIEIQQMFNIKRKVETYVEIEVNVNRVWVTYHMNKNASWSGIFEVVARVPIFLDLASPFEARELKSHFEYCK